jgi:hypothetical protein
MFSRPKAVAHIGNDESSAKQVEATRTGEELKVKEAFGPIVSFGNSVGELGS